MFSGLGKMTCFFGISRSGRMRLKSNQQVGADAVEEERPDLPAERERVRHRDELVLHVVHVLVHEEEPHVLQVELAVVDLLGHQAVGLRGADGHDEGDDLVPFRRLLELVHHLLGEVVVHLVQRGEEDQLPFGALHQLVRVQREDLAHFLCSLLLRHFCFSFQGRVHYTRIPRRKATVEPLTHDDAGAGGDNGDNEVVDQHPAGVVGIPRIAA